jgi:hypothetical protein
VVELKEKESEPNSDFDSKHKKGKQIIDAEPTATIVATTIKPEEPEELEEEECLYHSQMWVMGTPLHFIVDSESSKNLISIEVVKILKLPMMPHPQPYTIRWFIRGQDICVSHQCCMFYGIKPFKDEVMCDVSPLEVCDVLLGQPYMWKCHTIYESHPCNVIGTLGGHLYRVLEVASTTVTSLISPKQCHKVIFHTAKFSLFTIQLEGEQKDTVTIIASSQDISI